MTEDDTYRALMKPHIDEFIKMVQALADLRREGPNDPDWYPSLDSFCKKHGWSIRQYMTAFYATSAINREVPYYILETLDKHNF